MQGQYLPVAIWLLRNHQLENMTITSIIYDVLCRREFFSMQLPDINNSIISKVKPCVFERYKSIWTKLRDEKRLFRTTLVSVQFCESFFQSMI